MARRIVYGLYGKFFRFPLPHGYDLDVTLMDLQRDDSALVRPEVQEVLSLLGRHGMHKRFGKVLDIWCLKTDDDANSSVWALSLHSAFGFLAYTVPSDA